MSIISLTTDFGLNDWFVGTMKAVILGLQPTARIIDLTHGIPAGDIQSGAFALAAACPYFPAGTVHVVVVDPGVGSARAALAVKTARGFFVGPDNGVLSLALRTEEVISVRTVTNPRYLRPSVSRTFHGRDVFAPVGAHLASGVPISELGPEAESYQRVSTPAPSPTARGWKGVVLYVDRFGNIITNLTPDLSLFRRNPSAVRIQFVGHTETSILPVCDCYQAVNAGELLALSGSAGYLEICINGGNAAERLAVRAGTPFEVAEA